MDYVQIGALTALGTFAVVVGRIIWRLADRINQAEDAASRAETTASVTKLKTEALATELVEHRVNIAKEYVSRQALETLETKLIEAINRLGDRLDKLFQQNS